MSNKTIYFDHNKVKQLIEGGYSTAAAIELNDTFKLTIQSEKPQPLCTSIECIEGLANVVEQMRELLDQEKPSGYMVTLLELFKALRNTVILNREAQDFIASNEKLLPDLDIILTALFAKSSSLEVKDVLKIALQFLVNFVVRNAENGMIVWQRFEKPINNALNVPELFYPATALIFNIFLHNKDLIQSNSSLFEKIASISFTQTNEYVIFITQLYYEDAGFPVMFKRFDKKTKRFVLEYLKEKLLKKEFKITEHFLKTLSVEFKTKSDCILKTLDEYIKQIEPLEVKLLADILASLSSDEQYLKILQYDKSLFTNVACLLKCLHECGKQPGSEYSPMSKISEVTNVSEETEAHPVFGFKASLIRLLGNLCFKHKENQDLIRELEAIPVLLDCCNIDAKNPFIVQWVTLAIRNMCEGNQANQALIAAVTLKEPVNSALLEEMGLTVNSDANMKTGLIAMETLKKL